MIQDILRSTLIVGAVLVNVLAVGSAGHGVDAATQSAVAASQPSETAMEKGHPFNLNRMESLVPKMPRMTRMRGLRSGLATWYGKVLDRHRTASGEVFDSSALTGASNTLPFGTRVKVTNLRNGRSVVVRVNDRGILAPGNIIDLSSAAADRIGLLRMGKAPVHLDIVPAIL